MKTYQPTESEVKRAWHLIDAKGEILGRLSTKVATILMGKNKPEFSRHMDSGDFVVITNADKIVVTGRKAEQKLYITHSGYPGGYKEKKYAKVLEEHPERVLQHAVEGMLPDNKLKSDRMARLTVVAGDKNPMEDKFTK